MSHPAAAVVFDHLSEFARECLGIADEAVSKAAALDVELQKSKAETLVLTKIAASEEIPVSRVEGTVDRLIKTAFVKRANRGATIEGIRHASREELFAILEKLASIAVCPVSSLAGEDGELVEKAAGKTTDSSEEEDVWSTAWKQAKDEVGA